MEHESHQPNLTESKHGLSFSAASCHEPSWHPTFTSMFSLTPCSTVLQVKLTAPQLVKKFP